MEIQYLQVSYDQELWQILTLQKANLEFAISSDESREQGFVTVDHTFELLQKMNSPHGHIIAKNKKDQVIGYCLVMLPHFGSFIPILNPLIQKINILIYEGSNLANSKYLIMGQVCIDKAYRGQGIFTGLYQYMKLVLKNNFDFVVTSIALRNTRSVKAHEKVGFKVIEKYKDDSDDDWIIVLWKLS